MTQCDEEVRRNFEERQRLEPKVPGRQKIWRRIRDTWKHHRASEGDEISSGRPRRHGKQKNERIFFLFVCLSLFLPCLLFTHVNSFSTTAAPGRGVTTQSIRWSPGRWSSRWTRRERNRENTSPLFRGKTLEGRPLGSKKQRCERRSHSGEDEMKHNYI